MEIKRMGISTRISGNNSTEKIEKIEKIIPMNNDRNPNPEWQQKDKKTKKVTFQDYLKHLSK